MSKLTQHANQAIQPNLTEVSRLRYEAHPLADLGQTARVTITSPDHQRGHTLDILKKNTAHSGPWYSLAFIKNDDYLYKDAIRTNFGIGPDSPLLKGSNSSVAFGPFNEEQANMFLKMVDKHVTGDENSAKKILKNLENNYAKLLRSTDPMTDGFQPDHPYELKRIASAGHETLKHS